MTHSATPLSAPDRPATPLLDRVTVPADLRALSDGELARLADELRAEVIDAVSVTGGHLGSSLGVVELTVAIHAVFDAPRDKVIWDVGHQCYPHKILTGRRERIRSLRQEGGSRASPGAPSSAFDPFGAAHSSTSISAALGFATARDRGLPVGEVVAVIGDGAISAGMAWEALNNAGASGRRMFVILNDNDMSIAPPVGAVSAYLARNRTGAAEASLPGPAREGARRARDLVRGAALRGTVFEELGFAYVGPVDGHDVGALLRALRAARTLGDGPVLIHALTRKGRGYAPAEGSADRGHGVGKFDVATGVQRKAKPNAPSYTAVFAEALVRAAERDPLIAGVTAAMPDGTGISKLQARFPERAHDVGIAEQHAVTFAAGLAAAGMRPFCAIYSTFLQRGFDQVVHDVALQNLPVRFAIDRAGLVGDDGATHAGAFDLAYLCALPNFTVMAAADEAELARMVATAAAHDSGPIAFRYPRGEGTGVQIPEDPAPLEIGRGRVLRRGADVALLSLGGRLGQCLMAAEALEAQGLTCTVADARFAKPLDRELILELAAGHRALVTVEEGSAGGFGAHVLHLLAAEGALDRGLRIRTMTLPDRFIDQAAPERMYGQAGLLAADIEACALSALGA